MELGQFDCVEMELGQCDCCVEMELGQCDQVEMKLGQYN